MPMSIVATGVWATVYRCCVVTPSDSAVIVTAPVLSPVTFPNRSTDATVGLELRHVTTTPLRSLESGGTPSPVGGSAEPVYSRPGSAAIVSLVSAGHVTLTGMFSGQVKGSSIEG